MIKQALDNMIDYAPRSIDYADLDHAPVAYRQELVRLMAVQAYSELKAATEGVQWIAGAPDFRRRRLFARIVAEEAAHSAMIYEILARIGCPEAEAIAIAEGRGGPPMHEASLAGPASVGDVGNEWIDIMLNHMFLDRAGKFMISNFTEASFKPWADANRLILHDETGHVAFGYVEVRQWLQDQPDTVRIGDRVSTWYARGLNFFGPPSTRKGALLRAFGLKRQDNEQLRSAYRDEVQGVFLQLGCPELLRLQRSAFPF